MEKGCILPNNLLQELEREDNVVLHSLARFCACTEKELIDVLRIRNEGDGLGPHGLPKSRYEIYGYRTSFRKIKDKVRVINKPCDKLKKIQQKIKERLSFVPVSLSCTAGKIGDNVEKNAELHRYNPYLITMDIKDAYPSIHTHRVYKNLQGALTRPLKIRCPLLEKDEDKDLFIKALTHLCVIDDQLPQGASTSNQIQNIVMSGFDAKIEKRLPELSGSYMVYSRYADDIAISFPHFSTMEVLKEKMEKYLQELEEKEQEETTLSERIQNVMAKFSQETFTVTDKFELTYLQEKLKEMKDKIKNLSLSEGEQFAHIGILNGYKQKLKYSKWRIGDIEDALFEIIGGEGWTINTKKLHTWTPQSNTDRELNGMTFDHTGKRGIDKKKKSRYLRIFRDLHKFSIEELRQGSQFYRKKFKAGYRDEICISTITSVMDGIYNHIRGVYGKDNIPRDLTDAYKKAKAKWQDYPAREIAYKERKKQEEEKDKIENDGDNNSETTFRNEPGDYFPF